VLDDPYRLPFADGSVDIVLSGQMLEHCEFFWLTFAEMMRVLKPDGYLFLIAPSAGPIHEYPVDCYRFYPDAYRALAKHAGCHLHEVWLDERGPWRDLVGVFAKHPPTGDAVTRSTSAMRALAPTTVAPGSVEEEATRGAVPYLQVLQTLHDALQPSLYLEIGVRRGRSLALARGPAIGVDPAPELAEALPESTRLFQVASDDFFRDLAAQEMKVSPDLVFIDGMHLFEYALRDFMHVERRATPEVLLRRAPARGEDAPPSRRSRGGRRGEAQRRAEEVPQAPEEGQGEGPGVLEGASRGLRRASREGARFRLAGLGSCGGGGRGGGIEGTSLNSSAN